MVDHTDIFIKKILLKNYKELHNISENKGVSFQLFMRKTLTQIVDSYPEELKKQSTELEVQDLVRLYSVSPKTYTDLHNISKNINCSVSDLLKIELKKIADYYPQNFRNPPLDY